MSQKVILSTLFLALIVSYASATQTTYTFYPSGDSWFPTTAHPNDNHGSDTILKIQKADLGASHVLVKFSTDDILAAIGTSHVVSATLQLYIETNMNDWGSGANVDAYRLDSDWDEMSVTFNCQSDSNLSNTDPDCDDQWGGGDFEDAFSSTLLIQNSSIGWQNYLVTDDIQLLQSGNDNFGWIVRKRDSNASGKIFFTSNQGTAAQRPKLVVIVDDQTCTPMSVDSVSQGIIMSDGSVSTITVSGQNLNLLTQVLVDGTPISYTPVNSSTVTFTQSYSTAGDHNIDFYSSCITDPLYEQVLTADTQQYSTGSCSQTLPKVSFFALSSGTDRALCWNKKPTRLLGYSGDFNLVNNEVKWDCHPPVEQTAQLFRHIFQRLNIPQVPILRIQAMASI